MGLLSGIIAKGVLTAARNSTIKAAGVAATGVVSAAVAGAIATANAKQDKKDDYTVKNGILLIKPTRSSDEYVEQDAMDIVRELLGAGFNNITLKPVCKLGKFSAKRYGKISSISINGKSDFLGLKKVPSTVHIIIEYFDFKPNVDEDIYSRVKPIKVRNIYCLDDIEETSQVLVESMTKVKYCSNCGALIEKENAKFCFACGKELC